MNSISSWGGTSCRFWTPSKQLARALGSAGKTFLIAMIETNMDSCYQAVFVLNTSPSAIEYIACAAKQPSKRKRGSYSMPIFAWASRDHSSSLRNNRHFARSTSGSNGFNGPLDKWVVAQGSVLRCRAC